MKGLLENHFLFLAVFTCIAFVAFCAWEVSPQFNAMMHLKAFPDDDFRLTVVMLCVASVFGTFIVDRISVAIFAPQVGKELVKQAAATSITDIFPVFWTIGKVLVGFLVVGSGNPLIWIGAGWWWWRRRKAQQAALLQD